MSESLNHRGIESLENAKCSAGSISQSLNSSKIHAHVATLQANPQDVTAFRALQAQYENLIKCLAAPFVAKRMAENDDLMQEGLCGMLHAVRKFNPTRGNSFTTYSVWWIRHYVQLSCNRQPRHSFGHVPYNTRADARKMPHRNQAAIARAMASQPRMLHADMPDRPAPETLSADDLRALWTRLDRREQVVLTHRFGLHGEPRLDLSQVGQLIGRTRERVRQIETAALHKLRQHLEAPCRG